MAPSRSNYAVLPEPVLMEDRRSWNRGSNSGLWLMGVLSGLALLLTTALLVKTYVLNPHPVAHSHLGDGKVNKFDISQIQQIRPSPENDCYGDPSYWHEENFKYCCETAGTGPGCQSMHHNNDDLDRFDPESDNYQGFRGPGFDAPMFEGSYNPSYQSGSYDPTDSVGTIGSDGYPPEIVSHEVIDEDGPFQKSDPYADFEQPDPKDFHPKEEFIDCTSPKDDDTIKKLEICCHHGNAGCDILAAKKAAKKAAEEKESEEKRKKKEKEQKEKEEREKKEKEQKEKEEREKKEKEEKEKEEQEKKEREEKEKKEREEKEKKEREEKEKKLKEEKEEEPKEEKEEKPKEEKEAKPKEEKEEKPKEKKEEKPKEEEEKPKEEKEEKPKEDKEEKPKEEKEEKPKEEKEEKPKEEKETKDTPKPATPEQPKKPAEEKNEESSKDKTEKPKTKASETKLKVNLEEKNSEVLHYAKSLKELEEKYQAVDKQSKYLEREIEELRKKYDKSLNAMRQKIESTYTEKLKSKQKQVDDYQKRLLDEQSKSQRLDQTLKHLTSRLSQEKLRSKKLQDDLERYITRLSQENLRSKKLQDDLEHYITRLSQEQLRSKELEDVLEQYITSYNKDLKMMAGGKDDLETRFSKKEDELKVLQEELREKTVRLASISEKRLKQDQRRVENTVEFNTPTDLEKDFRDFFDGERIDACDVMESILKRDGDIDVDVYYPRLACIIFVTAYEVVKEAREAACDLFSNVTKQLIEETPRISQEFCLTRKEDGLSSHFPITVDVSAKKRSTEISSDVLDGLMLSLKQTAHVCNLNCFENVVAGFVQERWKKYDTHSLPAFSEEVLAQLSGYIKACIRLTWRMVTQVPPLQLEYNGVNFDKNIHKLTRFQRSAEHSSCDDHACYLWPALLEAGGRIIFPGEVLCKLESDTLDYVFI